MVLHIPLVHWGHLSWQWPLPTPCAPPAHSRAGQCRQKKPRCCASSAQQQLKHPCVDNSTISITNPKNSQRKLTLPWPKPAQSGWLFPGSLDKRDWTDKCVLVYFQRNYFLLTLLFISDSWYQFNEWLLFSLQNYEFTVYLVTKELFSTHL